MFDPNWEKIWPQRPSNVVFIAIFALLSIQLFVQLLLFALKGIPYVTYEKNLLIIPVPLLFAQHWT